MSPGIEIIQGVEDNVKRREPVDIELAILDIRMIGLNLGVRLELMRDLFGYLFSPPIMSDYLRRKPYEGVRTTREDHRKGARWSTHQSLGLLDMFVAEKELPVQIAQIDRIQIDYMDLTEAGQEEVLEELAADTTSAHEKNARLEAQ